MEFRSEAKNIWSKTGLSRWSGKPIIPFDEWIELTNTLHELDYFPDDFDQSLTYLLEDGLNGEQKGEDARKWNSDFLELMGVHKESKLWQSFTAY